VSGAPVLYWGYVLVSVPGIERAEMGRETYYTCFGNKGAAEALKGALGTAFEDV
jgi:hypothetical protein